MRAQVFNDYFKMQDEGLVPIIKCGNDADHGRPFVRYTEEDDIELFCLACDFILRPGLGMYERMIKTMAIINVDYLGELHGR